ncbi:MAG: protein translocase subunit SecDF [Flavobacteriaceae bacterium]|nr:protein translocase subunit SecDF [Flavobacteriaceae bacterium]
MKNKGSIRFFAIAFAVVCLFQLSFTAITYFVEEDARDFASGGKTPDDRKKLEKQFLDSVGNESAFPLLGFTYKECKEREINLGLDLKGGMNVTLEVSIPELIRNLSKNNQSASFNNAMADAVKAAESSQEDFVSLFENSFKKLSPNDKLAAIFANKDNKDFVKSSSSNDEVIKYIRKESDQAIDRSFQILRSRIDKFGTSQPKIQKLGNSGRILVELPGVDDPARVRKLLQGTAKLEFFRTYENEQFVPYFTSINNFLRGRLAGETDSSAATDTTAEARRRKAVQDSVPLFKYLTPNTYEKGELVKGAMIGFVAVKDTGKVNTYLNMSKAANIVPADMRFLWSAKVSERNKSFLELYVIKTERGNEPVLAGDVVVDAYKDVNQSGSIEVSMSMNGQGASNWARITGQNKGKCVAIVLDDVVYSAPNVNDQITGGRSSISGNFDQNEASDLANILKAGKLPAPARIVEEAVVGPTLGADNIQSGLLSFIIALLLVLVFMVLYYSNAGWVANIALFCNVFFIMGVLASLNAVLTMPGIAGIVLTIGLSVDANILIFERIREELLHGKGTTNAIRDGYKGAMSSILDSNITTLLLGIILYIFGSGPIQGFATTLIIGILTSLFSAIFITRLIFEKWMSKDREIRFSTNFSHGAFKNININWVGHRRKYYIFSAILIAAGIISASTKGFNFGVSFQGGRSYTVQFQKAVGNNEVRESLKTPFGELAPEVKTFGSEEVKKITTAYMINSTDLQADSIVEAKMEAGLESKFPGNTYTVIKIQKVGPTIADDIKQKAIWSVLGACVLMFLFIFVRFNKWQYGLGATAALFHDVLIVLSCFTLLNGVVPFALEIDEDFIAAILTVMGYSMTDTVVVFDRIREYLTVKKKRELEGEEKITVINMALNNTLSRTLITSLTIFIVLLAIFLFGGEVIRGFSFSLLIGIVIGTYSSICIATPIVIDFDRKDK